MKKQTKEVTDLRKDWKNEAEDEIILLQENIDELELPENTVLELEKLINKFKDRLNDTIDLFNVTPKIALADNDFFEDCLWEVEKISDAAIERMQTEIEYRGYTVIKAESLAEQMKVEAFLQEMTENPYQLKLIAC
jgi:hypothetical protein